MSNTDPAAPPGQPEEPSYDGSMDDFYDAIEVIQSYKLPYMVVYRNLADTATQVVSNLHATSEMEIMRTGAVIEATLNHHLQLLKQTPPHES